MSASPIERGLRGLCPACGEGRLFAGFLTFARSCEACGQNYKSEDVGDGASVFVIFIVGIFIVPLVLVFQFATNAPPWLMVIIWGPIVILACLWCLRLLRGIMFNLQFKTKAREVRAQDIQQSSSSSPKDIEP